MKEEGLSYRKIKEEVNISLSSISRVLKEVVVSKSFLDVYIRVSTTEQKKDGNSLAVQEDIEEVRKLGLLPRVHNEGARSSRYEFRQY